MSFGVTVDFNANVAKFGGQVDKLSNDLTKFSKKTESSFALAKKAVIGFAGAFGAVQFGKFVKGGIDTADMLSKLSDRTGVSVESLAGLKLAADLSGTSLSEVGLSINKLSIFMGQNAEAARELGISAKEPIEAFLQFTDLFAGIEDQSQKAALGNKILGRSFANLAPLLNQGSDALREQIKQGKEYLPITEEMGKQAAEFNDNMTKLSASTSQYAIVLGGPIVDGFNGLISKLQEATGEAVTFNNVLKGVGNFAFGADIFATTEFDQLTEEIKIQIAKIKVLKAEAKAGLDNPLLAAGAFVDGILGFDVKEEERKLELMIRQLEKLTVDFNKKRQGLGGGVSNKKTSLSSNEINDALGIKGGSSSQKFSKSVSSVSKPIKGLSQSVGDATGPMSEWTKLLQEADIVIATTKTPLEELNTELSLYTTLADRGLISQEVLNRALVESGENYNALTDDVKVSTDKMSVFADEAARNMQGAFADFLFDPFEKGLGGMLEGFATLLQRMLAEAAAAELFDLFKSESSGGSGLGGTIFDGVLGAFSGTASVNHGGGIAGSSGIQRAVNPLMFANAPRFHNGGFPGLAADEVPIIAQKGEQVLSKQQVASSRSSGINISTHVEVSGNSGGDNAKQLGKVINAKIKQVLVEEKRPGGLLA